VDQPALVAIKESSENVRCITDLVLESVLLGAQGWNSGLVNAFPAENRALWNLATSGRWEPAGARAACRRPGLKC
jgi:4-hydroxy-tetrahydrodipicolinate synthase